VDISLLYISEYQCQSGEITPDDLTKRMNYLDESILGTGNPMDWYDREWYLPVKMPYGAKVRDMRVRKFYIENDLITEHGVNPMIMCRKHLIAEHAEIHMCIGSLKFWTPKREDAVFKSLPNQTEDEIGAFLVEKKSTYQNVINGYIRENCIESKNIEYLKYRHDELVDEITSARRGYNHYSPLTQEQIQSLDLSWLTPEQRNASIDADRSLAHLLYKCPVCAEQYSKDYGTGKERWEYYREQYTKTYKPKLGSE